MKNNVEIGRLGEEIAVEYLMREKFSLIKQNTWLAGAEIDIIAAKNHKIHFIEVKTVSYETKKELIAAVTHETWRPEERVDHNKRRKIAKAVSQYTQKEEADDWQVDVLAIRVVPRETYATVNYLEHVL